MYIIDMRSKSYSCPVHKDVCLGSGCAMWRWKPELNPDWKPKHDMLMTGPGHDYRTEPPPYIDSKTHGYCGMATRPNLPG